MDRFFAISGAVSAFIAVSTGAFGAHALKERLPADLLDIFEVGMRYQMYHALALLAVGDPVVVGVDSNSQRDLVTCTVEGCRRQ